MGNWHVWIYFTGHNWIQVKIFKPRFDSQFPLSLSPNSWIIRARKQRKFRIDPG